MSISTANTKEPIEDLTISSFFVNIQTPMDLVFVVKKRLRFFG
jgi:hypothetical protein